MRTRFVLVVRPDGQALLTTKEPLSAELIAAVEPVLDGWAEGRTPIVLIGETDVGQVREISIDLVPAGVAQTAERGATSADDPGSEPGPRSIAEVAR